MRGVAGGEPKARQSINVCVARLPMSGWDMVHRGLGGCGGADVWCRFVMGGISQGGGNDAGVGACRRVVMSSFEVRGGGGGSGGLYALRCLGRILLGVGSGVMYFVMVFCLMYRRSASYVSFATSKCRTYSRLWSIGIMWSVSRSILSARCTSRWDRRVCRFSQ